MKNKPLVYVGGGLFTEKDAWQRNREATLLRQYDFLNVFNPLTDNDANEKDDIEKLAQAEDIFTGDTEQILKSRYILGEIDGFDPGLMFEKGIAVGVNTILELLTEEERERVGIPFKTLVGHSSDIRTELAGEYDGMRVPVGWNQYVIGAYLVNDFPIFSNCEDAIEWIAEEESV